ncbi:ParA family protein [Haloarcula amylovorans]|uniref:ParA family protein n=1 Tax=Haloarcula amylovorans TaxID=2562280 RepID=UPI001075FCAA|nr:ParA family protein [Halomicroarcula amylolytica]
MTETLRAATYIDKGGTGKTTATAHLGVACARQGHEVLLVDLAGKQGDLAKQFGVWDNYRQHIESDEAWPNVTTVFQDEWDAIAEKFGEEVVEELIIRTNERVDILPSHPGLDALDAELNEIDDIRERYGRFDRFLTDYIDPLRYDIVLIDLPGVSTNVSYNGLWAARNVVVPVKPEKFDVSQLRRLEADIQRMQSTFDAGIEVTMVIPNGVDLRTRLADAYLDALREEYSETVAPIAVPDSQDVRNAAAAGQTAFRLSSPSETAEKARRAFVRNAEALVDRLQESEVQRV